MRIKEFCGFHGCLLNHKNQISYSLQLEYLLYADTQASKAPCIMVTPKIVSQPCKSVGLDPQSSSGYVVIIFYNHHVQQKF